MQACSVNAVANSWHGAREISRPVPQSHWAPAINMVLQQVHPGYVLSEDGMLMMMDLVDWWLHLIVTEAEQLVLPFDSKLSEVRGGLIPVHQILAHRDLPDDAFLISFQDGKEPTWELREDALLAGINLAAFEARPTAEVDKFYHLFCAGGDFVVDALTARHIQTAVRLVVRGELAKHAIITEGTKAVTKLASGCKDRGRTARAGLKFPVDVVGCLLACGLTVSDTASSVYLAATLEYLTAEMLELGGNCAGDEMLELGGNCAGDKRTAITVRHLTLAVSIFPLSLAFVMSVHYITVIFDIKHPAQAQVHNDEELVELLKCCTLLRGGVFPNIRDTLFDPRQHSEQAFKRVPNQIKLLTRAGEAYKPEVRQTCESRTGSVDVVVNRGDVLVVTN